MLKFFLLLMMVHWCVTAVPKYVLMKQFVFNTPCDNPLNDTEYFSQLVLARVNECVFFDNLQILYWEYDDTTDNGTLSFYSNYGNLGCKGQQIFQEINVNQRVTNRQRVCYESRQMFLSDSLEDLWNDFQVDQWMSKDTLAKVCYTNISCVGHMNNIQVQKPLRSCSTYGELQSDDCHALSNGYSIQSQCLQDFNVSHFPEIFQNSVPNPPDESSSDSPQSGRLFRNGEQLSWTLLALTLYVFVMYIMMM